ncbi:MAG TPA: histidinol-phosphatase HisJ family protein [Eubacteriales bacterium]|nr:histidinol-phosphatase HisJ family protein [Clostridia bacterium]HRR89603.1 histidinol-phosphatase HisJ family protein [Eubacteriales bacterium]HRU84630.1 histidinol-phosphatase HisJ family protein [Eubacteriales bacterium]
MIDTHTHSTYSFDGKQTLRSLVETAAALGLDYVASTEHHDLDLAAAGFTYCRPLDLAAYFAEAQALKEEFFGKIYYAIGLEVGHSAQVERDYRLERYKTDVIINSIHLVEGEDVYKQEYYLNSGNREMAYGRYFKAVRRSLDAPYHFDIVGHFGYIGRRSPYAEPALKRTDAPEVLDDVLKTIIKKNKCLEINSHIGFMKSEAFVPSLDILKRYRELGGELITFGSDGHTGERIGERYAQAAAAAASAGFKFVFVYKNHVPEGVRISL